MTEENSKKKTILGEEKTETKKKRYSETEDYEVLEDIPHIQNRPALYVGSTDQRGFNHLLWEVIDNSVDEAVAGRCSEIRVILSENQREATVIDNGSGVAMGIHPKTQKSILFTVFYYLKAGGKFTDKIYKSTAGLHGMGVTATNALSSSLKAINRRQGKTQIVEFSRGSLVSETITDTPGAPDGLTVTFTPDPLIFGSLTYFKVDVINERLKELAYLNPNLTIFFQRSPTEEAEVYRYTGGLSSWIEELTRESALTGTEIFSENWNRFEPPINLSFAWRYTNNREYLNKSFCNNVATISGGTHLEGFEQGLTTALRDWIKDKYPQLQNKISILKDDVLDGLVALVSVKVVDPQFSGQTKSSLTDKYIRENVRGATYDLTKKFLQDNASTAEIISQKIILSSQNRVKTEEYQKSLKDSSRPISPSKLLHCVSKVPEETSLFLAEGYSAGASAKGARNPENQAILAVQGKILNAEKSDSKKVFSNEEVRNILNALGLTINEAAQNNYLRYRQKLDDPNWTTVAGLPEDFLYLDETGQEKKIPAHTRLNREQVEFIVEKSKRELLKKMRYGRVVIMVDADQDGDHILALFNTLFFNYCRFLLEEERIYLAVPPLYRVQSKKINKYLRSEKDLEEFLREHKLSEGSYTISRFKGLGEMNALQLRETTMDPKTARFYKLKLNNIPQTYDVIDKFMGPNSEHRRLAIENESYQNIVLEVIDDEVETHHSLFVSFISYTKAVVEARAIPAAEDGLKPVQRRILLSCRDLDLTPARTFRKTNKLAGAVMGDYHPHGDKAIEDAIAKLVQDFVQRMPILAGQGNFGSIDYDSSAQTRYTEVNTTHYGHSLLEDIHLVEHWDDNYDYTKKEPKFLAPNLNILINGSFGIAVGISSSFAPNNPAEVAEAVIQVLENPQITLDQLEESGKMPFPDFPTSGKLLEADRLKSIYETGEGTFYVRGKGEIVSSSEKKKADTIKIYEIPYRVSKAKIVEQINDLIKNKKIEGLRAVEDYSHFEKPVNFHIRFDPNYDSSVIMDQLFKYTDLQTTFSVKMRALKNGRPKLWSLMELINYYIELRLKHIQNKANYIYDKNLKELEHLGVRKFITENHQRIAEIIRLAKEEEEIKSSLRQEFDLPEGVVNRILDTPSTLRQFTPERKQKLQKDIDNLNLENEYQRSLIESEENRKTLLKNELRSFQEKYSHEVRKTEVSYEKHFISERQLIPFEERFISFSRAESKNKVSNYLTVNNSHFIEPTNIPSQGKELRARGKVWRVMRVNRREDIWLFTNYNRLYVLHFYKIMGVNRTINLDEEYFVKESGKEITPILRASESFVDAIPIKENEVDRSILLITKKGKVRVWRLSSLIGKIGKSGKQLLKSQKAVERCPEHQELLTKHVSSHPCGFTCQELRKIHREVSLCSSCQVKWEDDADQISKVCLVKKDELVDAVVKRRSASGVIKNQRVSLYRLVREKNLVKTPAGSELMIPKYCDKHQALANEHYLSHEAKKEKCSPRCVSMLDLQKIVRQCTFCQESHLFSKLWKRQIRSEEVVSLISYSEKDKGLILIFRKDGTLEKKTFSANKKFIGIDSRLKKTPYCQKHWNHLEDLKKARDRVSEECQNEKSEFENNIIKSAIPLADKKHVLKVIQLPETKDLAKRLLSSPIDETISKELIEEQILNLIQLGKNYQKFAQILENFEKKYHSLREQIASCGNCQKYCKEHDETALVHSEDTCPHCSRTSSKEINEEIRSLKAKLEEENASPKTLAKLREQILAKEEEKKRINKELFTLRISCPVLREFKDKRQNCVYCQKQVQKKYLAKISNPVTLVLLIKLEEGAKNEMYVLTEQGGVCLYSKKDLGQFLSSESRSRALLKGEKSLADVFFYQTHASEEK